MLAVRTSPYTQAASSLRGGHTTEKLSSSSPQVKSSAGQNRKRRKGIPLIVITLPLWRKNLNCRILQLASVNKFSPTYLRLLTLQPRVAITLHLKLKRPLPPSVCRGKVTQLTIIRLANEFIGSARFSE